MMTSGLFLSFCKTSGFSENHEISILDTRTLLDDYFNWFYPNKNEDVVTSPSYKENLMFMIFLRMFKKE